MAEQQVDVQQSGGGVICALSRDTVNLLKSSQVITSVSAIIKELSENALDAGATLLTVRLEEQGLKRVEVRDNGCGISEADLQQVCLPHTTSKITAFSDLESLNSYGFRGEALCSLCQVASVTISSKHGAARLGYTCRYSMDGRVSSRTVAVCNTGTTVSVTGLFQQLPVRRRYHSDSRRRKEQLKRIEDLLLAYSLARPALHVMLYSDRQVVFQKSPACDTRQALHAVFPDFARCLRHAVANRDQVEVCVYLPAAESPPGLAAPSHGRSTADRLALLVNGRPVRQKTIEKLIKSHFSLCSEGPHGRYPCGLVSVTLPPAALDVNLEPNKDRVLFTDQDVVLELLTSLLTDIYGPVRANNTGGGVKGTSGHRQQQQEEDMLVCSLAQPTQSVASSIQGVASAASSASDTGICTGTGNNFYSGHDKSFDNNDRSEVETLHDNSSASVNGCSRQSETGDVDASSSENPTNSFKRIDELRIPSGNNEGSPSKLLPLPASSKFVDCDSSSTTVNKINHPGIADHSTLNERQRVNTNASVLGSNSPLMINENCSSSKSIINKTRKRLEYPDELHEGDDDFFSDCSTNKENCSSSSGMNEKQPARACGTMAGTAGDRLKQRFSCTRNNKGTACYDEAPDVNDSVNSETEEMLLDRESEVNVVGKCKYGGRAGSVDVTAQAGIGSKNLPPRTAHYVSATSNCQPNYTGLNVEDKQTRKELISSTPELSGASPSWLSYLSGTGLTQPVPAAFESLSSIDILTDEEQNDLERILSQASSMTVGAAVSTETNSIQPEVSSIIETVYVGVSPECGAADATLGEATDDAGITNNRSSEASYEGSSSREHATCDVSAAAPGAPASDLSSSSRLSLQTPVAAGPINPTAWSKGHVFAEDGSNIESVRLLGAGNAKLRRSCDDADVNASPAKRQKTHLETAAQSTASVTTNSGTSVLGTESLPTEGLLLNDKQGTTAASSLGRFTFKSGVHGTLGAFSMPESRHPVHSSPMLAQEAEGGQVHSAGAATAGATDDVNAARNLMLSQDNTTTIGCINNTSNNKTIGDKKPMLSQDNVGTASSNGNGTRNVMLSQDSTATNSVADATTPVRNNGDQRNLMLSQDSPTTAVSQSCPHVSSAIEELDGPLPIATTAGKRLGRPSPTDRRHSNTVLATCGTERQNGGQLVRKPVSAFASFAGDIRNEVLAQFPGAAFTVVGREIAARWKALSTTERERYEQLAAQDSVRYHEDVRQAGLCRGPGSVAFRDAAACSPNSSLDRLVAPVTPSLCQPPPPPRRRQQQQQLGSSPSLMPFLVKKDEPGVVPSLPAEMRKGYSKTELGGATPKSRCKARLSAGAGSKGSLVGPVARPWQARGVTVSVTVASIRSSMNRATARSLDLNNSISNSNGGYKIIGKIRYPATNKNGNTTYNTNTSVIGTEHSASSQSAASQSASSASASSPLSAASAPSSGGVGGVLCFACLDPSRSVISGVHGAGLQELLLCYRLMETMCVPTKPLLNAMPFNQSTLGDSNWRALVRLQRDSSTSSRHAFQRVTDLRIVNNGLDVALYAGADGCPSHGELQAVAASVGFYGLTELREVLAVLAASPGAALVQTRPVKLRHWLQGECVRLSRASSSLSTAAAVTEELRLWQQYTRKYYNPSTAAAANCAGAVSSGGTAAEAVPVAGLPEPSVCLHGKALLYQLYDLDQLPGSQQPRPAEQLAGPIQSQ